MIEEVRFIDSVSPLAPRLAQFDRPWLGPYNAADHELLVSPSLTRGSVALIPLPRDNRAIGVIAFGSRDPQRFTHDLAADFLAHLGVIVAISLENAVNRARLLRSGVTDFLTGWHNRRYFHNRLREELARAERTGKALACLMIDIDHFKEINDRFGHLAGDEALKEVARRAEAEIRAGDTGARFGGDEFAILLAGAESAAGAQARRAHSPGRGLDAGPGARRRARDGDAVDRRRHGAPAAALARLQGAGGTSDRRGRRGAVPRQERRPQSRRSLDARHRLNRSGPRLEPPQQQQEYRHAEQCHDGAHRQLARRGGGARHEVGGG